VHYADREWHGDDGTSGRRAMIEPVLPARFLPLRRASRAKRRVLLVAGPLLWLVALLVVAVVIHRTNAVEYALLVLAVSFAVALFLLGCMRAARAREERDA
jgi:peptidoglycan/LPS O-acetylase OafA/YrhL